MKLDRLSLEALQCGRKRKTHHIINYPRKNDCKKYYHGPQSPADLQWSEGAKNLRFSFEDRNLEC